MKNIIFYTLLILLPLGKWGETTSASFFSDEVIDEQYWAQRLSDFGYVDLSEVEQIKIEDAAYTNINGDQKKVSLEVKILEDGSEKMTYELTDILENNIAKFNQNEGSATATIHYVTSENSEAKLLELKDSDFNKNRTSMDYTEDIYIVDLAGDGRTIQVFTSYFFSDAFRSTHSKGETTVKTVNNLGIWTKKLLFEDFKKLMISNSSKKTWAATTDVLASYTIISIDKYSSLEQVEFSDVFYSVLLENGFTGFITGLLDAYGETLSPNLVSYIISTTLQARHAGFIKSLPLFTKDFLSSPEIANVLLDKKLLAASKLLYPSPYSSDIGSLELFADSLVVASYQRVLTTGMVALYPNIPVAELTAMQYYSNKGYWGLNKALRKGDLSNYYKAFETMTNRGLSKLPKYKGTSYRGTALDVQLVLSKYKRAYDEGLPINEPHFTSATKLFNIAEEYANAEDENLASKLDPSTPNKKAKILFYFESEGVPDLEDIAYYGRFSPTDLNEEEVLFKSNTNFEVTNFKEDRLDENGNVIVEVFLKEISRG